MTDRTCQTCGEGVGKDAAFCASCGARPDSVPPTVETSPADEAREIAKGFGRVDHRPTPRRGLSRLQIGGFVLVGGLILVGVLAGVAIHMNSVPPPPDPFAGQAPGSFAPSLSSEEGCAHYVSTMAAGIASGALDSGAAYRALGTIDPLAQATTAFATRLLALQYQVGASAAITRVEGEIEALCAKPAYSSAYSRDVASGNIVPGVFP